MEVLYKYVPKKRIRACIPEVGDGTLRATQPAALNDPFECAIRPFYGFPDEGEENRELATVLTDFNENKPVTEQDVRRAREEHRRRFTWQLFTDQISTRFGIVSFAANPRHPLMWSHYTTDGSGFVIGYDLAELNKLACPSGWLRRVKYGKTLVPIYGPVVPVAPDSNLPKLLSYKSEHWSYEQEWRLIVELRRTIGTGKTDRHGQPINLVRIPNEAVVSVYFTERTPTDSVRLVQERLADENNRYRAGKPRKLVRSSTEFGYEEAPEGDDI